MKFRRYLHNHECSLEDISCEPVAVCDRQKMCEEWGMRECMVENQRKRRGAAAAWWEVPWWIDVNWRREGKRLREGVWPSLFLVGGGAPCTRTLSRSWRGPVIRWKGSLVIAGPIPTVIDIVVTVLLVSFSSAPSTGHPQAAGGGWQETRTHDGATTQRPGANDTPTVFSAWKENL